MKASRACVEDCGSRVLTYVECNRREQGAVVVVVERRSKAEFVHKYYEQF